MRPGNLPREGLRKLSNSLPTIKHVDAVRLALEIGADTSASVLWIERDVQTEPTKRHLRTATESIRRQTHAHVVFPVIRPGNPADFE